MLPVQIMCVFQSHLCFLDMSNKDAFLEKTCDENADNLLPSMCIQFMRKYDLMQKYENAAQWKLKLKMITWFDIFF